MYGLTSGIERIDRYSDIRGRDFLKIILSSKFMYEDEENKDLILPVGVWNSEILELLRKNEDVGKFDIYVEFHEISLDTSIVKSNEYVIVKDFFELFTEDKRKLVGSALTIVKIGSDWHVRPIVKGSELRELNFLTGTLPFQQLTFTRSNGESYEVQNTLIPMDNYIQSILEKEVQYEDYELLVKKELCEKLIQVKEYEGNFLETLLTETKEGTHKNILALIGEYHQFVRQHSDVLDGYSLRESVDRVVKMILSKEIEFDEEEFNDEEFNDEEFNDEEYRYINIEFYPEEHIYTDYLLSSEDIEKETPYRSNYLVSYQPGISENLSGWVWDNDITFVYFSDFSRDNIHYPFKETTLNEYIKKTIDIMREIERLEDEQDEQD